MKGARPRCRYCGKPLGQVYRILPERWSHNAWVRAKDMGETDYRAWKRRLREPTGTYGYQGTGFFCTQSCGHQWAVRRLQREEG